MTDHSGSTIRASPGAAAADAVPDPADLRNHVQSSDYPGRRTATGD